MKNSLFEMEKPVLHLEKDVFNIENTVFGLKNTDVENKMGVFGTRKGEYGADRPVSGLVKAGFRDAALDFVPQLSFTMKELVNNDSNEAF